MHRTFALPMLIGLAIAAAFPGIARAAGRAMTVDDLLAVRSVSDPQVSPDGKQVVYVVSEVDREAGKTNSSLWMVSVAGGAARRLTNSPGVNLHPRWSPDGKSIALVSSRGGSSQVWVLPVDGGEAWQLTKLPVDVSGPIWSPLSDRIAFASEVYPGKTPEQTAARDKEQASKSKARVYDHLMVRHWNAWDEGKRSHLFVVDVISREVIDVTPKLEVNAPPAPFGGSDDTTWAPDGRSLVFTAEPLKDPAWSTNTDLWEVTVPGGKLTNLTEKNPAADAKPAFSPDGHWLAYVRQSRAGFESDLWVLTLLRHDTGAVFELTRTLDRPVQSFVWQGPDQLLAVIDEAGTEPAVLVEFATIADGTSVTVALPRKFPRVVRGGAISAFQAARKDGNALRTTTVVFVRSTADHPGELYKASSDGSGLSKLTHHNDGLVAGLDLPRAEPFTFKGADGADVSGWLVRPPGFDPNRRYPVAFLIHGGPQGAWHDEWHARWNYQMFASPGFAVVAINPRGSTGYGQKFTNEISQDWTGRVYDDLMKGLDHALKAYPFLDGDRVGAAGGSYGGFMVDWIAGHSDRFKVLVSHAGVFDLASEYGETEELWFAEWEFGGTPWEKAEHYRTNSPSRYVEHFKTPTLVVHGALDYRVSDGQGLGMFSALQRRGVPSRLLYFPDEGHWILKPANRIVWWNEVLDWMNKYLKN
jgi:dipeptidyl aminopeptidase/acylaminoacyl peptidase